ncbi:N-glycosylase/DNA lyase [Candidatus Pacearchaeota archaeon]|nr:N-glycosylase/DNA lyase [Candidatus Pacearchaeota archaeon]
MDSLLKWYAERKNQIKSRLNDFKSLKDKEYFNELLFCLLTPQSNAQSCWKAVLELKKVNLEKAKKTQVADILKSKTRFHNNKAGYILEAARNWNDIKEKLNNNNSIELRNWLAENVKGFGYKEAGHFLRNIGKSNNKIAILDRHILRNLKDMKVIEEDKIKNKNHYFKVENNFLKFSNKIKIPIDELDLLFWSKKNREVFK